MTSISYGFTILPLFKSYELISSLNSNNRFNRLPVGITTAPANANFLVIS